MPGSLKLEKITSANASDLRQLTIQHNNLVKDVAALMNALTADALLGWYGVGPNSLTTPMGIGSTDTQVGTAANVFTIAGVPVIKAIVSAGTAIGAQTVPADTWALYAVDIVAAGTISITAAAANATTGYATEALAIAALPARITVKARLGYFTVKTMTGQAWIAATDALAGGTTGNEASQTNYYPYAGAASPQGLAYNANGIVSLGLIGSPTPTFHPAWVGGKNGVLQATVLNIASADVAVASSAFMFNANGLTNVPKAAVTAGTVFGALGTIPADKWGIYGMMINGAGTITWMSGPANYTTGYSLESQAIGDLGNMFPTAGLAFMGYVTVKTGSGLAWITGTDALAGGTTGNEASYTNYYPTTSVTLASGESASLIANRQGQVLTSASY